MALTMISQQVIDAVYQRLNAADGYNTTLTASTTAHNLPTFDPIDFSPSSMNFFFAQVDPDQLEQTSIFTYPLLLIYALESGQVGDQKFAKFSGVVRVIVEVFVSWKSIRGLHDFERYLSAVEDAVIDVMNRTSNQDWANPLVYNGQIQSRRGGLHFAGENWRQKIAFSLLFELHE